MTEGPFFMRLVKNTFSKNTNVERMIMKCDNIGRSALYHNVSRKDELKI